jgi:hypothetical protein
VTKSRLAATVDGRRLEPAQARALWERFSAYMQTHRGDFGGFARAEGYAHAAVSAAGGVAMLTLESAATSRQLRRDRKSSTS